jgi:fructose-1,6-bisphosphatase/inositol monophosphatase family enzyme
MEENTCTKKLFDLTCAIENAACKILEKNLVVWQKEDGTPVSNIDIGLETAIIEIVQAHYPEDRLICEEGAPAFPRPGSEYSWVIDPIDGTDNFIHQKKEFGISVGLMKGDQFVEALLIFPKLNERYYASKGGGILKNGEVFFRGQAKSNKQEVILCSKTYQRLRPLFESKGYGAGYYKCATYSLLLLLQRKAIAYHTINTMLYDVGPMAFIISEAGIHSFNREKRELLFNRKDPFIPFFLSISDNQIPDEIYQVLISH